MSETKKFTDGNAQKVANALLVELTQIGLYARSKNDFYEFALYTLDKYSSDRFFSQNSNEQNARLLKVSDTRIKAAKKNISVKFMDTTEYNNVFENFLKSLACILEKYGVECITADGSYTFAIEDTVARSALEAKLKENAGETLDYKTNSEIVTIGRDAFCAMLEAENKSSKCSDEAKKELEYILGVLKNKKIREDTLSFIERLISSTSKVEFACNIVKQVVSVVAKNKKKALPA